MHSTGNNVLMGAARLGFEAFMATRNSPDERNTDEFEQIIAIARAGFLEYVNRS